MSSLSKSRVGKSIRFWSNGFRRRVQNKDFTEVGVCLVTSEVGTKSPSLGAWLPGSVVSLLLALAQYFLLFSGPRFGDHGISQAVVLH